MGISQQQKKNILFSSFSKNGSSVFSAYEFSEEGWILPSTLTTSDYDPTTGELVLLVQDHYGTYKMASVFINSMAAATGAELTNGYIYTQFKIYR